MKYTVRVVTNYPNGEVHDIYERTNMFKKTALVWLDSHISDRDAESWDIKIIRERSKKELKDAKAS